MSDTNFSEYKKSIEVKVEKGSFEQDILRKLQLLDSNDSRIKVIDVYKANDTTTTIVFITIQYIAQNNTIQKLITDALLAAAVQEFYKQVIKKGITKILFSGKKYLKIAFNTQSQPQHIRIYIEESTPEEMDAKAIQLLKTYNDLAANEIGIKSAKNIILEQKEGKWTIDTSDTSDSVYK